eukprot:gene14111-5102_t
MSTCADKIMVIASDMEQSEVAETNTEKGIVPVKDSLESINNGLGTEGSQADDAKRSQNGKTECKGCTCPCHSTSINCIFEEKSTESIKFRELLLLHLDIIEEQNERLQSKEKQIHHLRSENEHLNARINRMERRVALKIRKQVDDDTDSVKSKASSTQKSSRSYSICSTELPRRPRKSASYGTVGVTISSKQNKDVGTGLFLKTDVDYLQAPSYSIAEAPKEPEKDIKIPVPSWKDIPVEHTSKVQRQKLHHKASVEGIDEVTDDESYQRRHLKMELDEIRRKKWDIQQLRQERMQENLRQRQREREDPSQLKTQSKADDIKVKCLHPPSGNVMAIEVVNEVPVFALGARIPQLERS